MRKLVRSFAWSVVLAVLVAPPHAVAGPGVGNERIAFVTNRNDGQPGWNGFCCHIDTMTSAGADVQNLLPDFVKDFAPAWSPDGTRIAFATDAKTGFPTGSTEAIYVANADGSDARRLTEIGQRNDLPTWSPDGREIAFLSDRDGNWDLYVMNADGTNVRNVTRNTADNCACAGDEDVGFGSRDRPSWSPDGSLIAFSSDLADSGRNLDVFTIHPDGTGLRRLTKNLAEDGWPDWSPDGSQIAFESYRDGDDEIYVMSANGGAVRQLTFNEGIRDGNPEWSPDGRSIAFTSQRDDLEAPRDDIFVMNADGSNPVNLTHDPGKDDRAAWQPLP